MSFLRICEEFSLCIIRRELYGEGDKGSEVLDTGMIIDVKAE